MAAGLAKAPSEAASRRTNVEEDVPRRHRRLVPAGSTTSRSGVGDPLHTDETTLTSLLAGDAFSQNLLDGEEKPALPKLLDNLLLRLRLATVDRRSGPWFLFHGVERNPHGDVRTVESIEPGWLRCNPSQDGEARSRSSRHPRRWRRHGQVPVAQHRLPIDSPHRINCI